MKNIQKKIQFEDDGATEKFTNNYKSFIEFLLYQKGKSKNTKLKKNQLIKIIIIIFSNQIINIYHLKF